MSAHPFSSAAFFAAASSASIHGGYVALHHKLPVYFRHECLNYSIFPSHWGAIAAAMAFAGIGASFLAASIWRKPHGSFAWINLVTFLLLVPALYTGCCIAMIFLWSNLD